MYAAFHWQLSRQLAVEGQTQFRKKAIQRVQFLGHSVMFMVNADNICNKKSAPEFLKPSPVVWREIRSDGKTSTAVAAQV